MICGNCGRERTDNDTLFLTCPECRKPCTASWNYDSVLCRRRVRKTLEGSTELSFDNIVRAYEEDR